MRYTKLGETDLNVSSDLSRGRARARPTNIRWGVIALLFFATTINYLDRTNLSVALPILSETYSWTPAAMGAISSAFAITYTLAQMPVGALIDRIGSRLTYIGSLIVWSLASMATAIGNGFASIYVFRLILGIGEAPAFPPPPRQQLSGHRVASVVWQLASLPPA